MEAAEEVGADAQRRRRQGANLGSGGGWDGGAEEVGATDEHSPIGPRRRTGEGRRRVEDKVGLVGCLGKDVVGWRLTWAKEQGSPSHSLFPLFISLFPYLYICIFI